MPGSISALLLILLWLLFDSGEAKAAPSASQSLLVVYNADFAGSRSLANYYAAKRQIAADHVVALHCSNGEEIDRSSYHTEIERPLTDQFTLRGWWQIDPTTQQITKNQIRFIALIRGIPLKIKEAASTPGDGSERVRPELRVNAAAVDSEVAALAFRSNQISGPRANPYYRSFVSAQEADPRLMFVTRLDGPSSADVTRVIDDSLRAESAGLYGWTLLDARGTADPAYQTGEQWLQNIYRKSFSEGRPAILDSHERLFPAGYPINRVMMYFGWYSIQPTGLWSNRSFRLVPGSIAVHVHSLSGSTVRSTESGWIAPLLEHGAAASIGNVYEPYLALSANLDVLHDRLLRGMTLAESVYASLPEISWMSTCVGDPLYHPFQVQANASDRDPFRVFQRLTLRYRDDQSKWLMECRARAVQAPVFNEWTGLWQAQMSRSEEALTDLKSAEEHGRSIVDRFRACLDQIDYLEALGRREAMRDLIRSARARYHDDRALEILDLY